MEGEGYYTYQSNSTKKILVLGAGYGGLRVAMRLGRALRASPAAEVFLIDQFDYHQLITELHEVAAASIPPTAASIPLTQLLRGLAVTFVQTRVTGFDFDAQRVATETGEMPYDILVIALGSETDYFGIEGMGEHSLTLKSLLDALSIKERVERTFALAAAEPDSTVRRRLLTIVIGGGGFTGTELAAEMADRARELAKEHGLAPEEATVGVIEASKNLLSGFEPKLVQWAREILGYKGVDLYLGAPAIRVTADTVELKNGQTIPYHTLIWAGGVKANDLVARSGLQTGVRGRVVVNPFMETVDYSNVFVVGDASLVLNHMTGRPLAPSAQLALQEANCAVRNILAQLQGREFVPFRPRIAGEVVSVGRRDALAKVGPISFDGVLAHMLKRMTVLRYLYMLGGIQLSLDWLRLISH